jgi:hypothetical protein
VKNPSELLAQMSAHELIDLYYSVLGHVLEISAALVTVLFAFATVAHFAGSKLTKSQVWMLSLLYSFAMLVGTASVYSDMQFASLIMEYSLGIKSPEYFAYAIVIFFLLSWILSISFMIESRGKRGST